MQERFFGANWREEYAVLYEDSSLLWYKSRERRQPEGALMLRCAPELMAVGVFTRAVPRQPEAWMTAISNTGWGGPASAFDTGYYYSDAVGADADYDYEADFGDFGGDFGGF
ncbi:hypothetical protein FJT64_008043 [Amphibalanus amphitrite]|uniref:PH domain-containing protein n=1 Tax=Amphibalanus amphitrite TaxID=1232801 RepID=A0A6A4VJR6_AMPAM|nr:hypothetical protein FJT64_008043 [Amphibalanus amphitrite]